MLTRRRFIQHSSLFAAALMAAPSDFFKMHKDLGIQLYTVRDEVAKDLEHSLSEVSKAGYTMTELYGYDYKTRQFFGRSVKEMAALLKKHQLSTPSGHYNILDMMYDTSYNWDSWKNLLEDATILGNKYVVIPYMDDSHRTADNFKLMAERLNKAGELSKAAGMTTGYHNHWFEFDAMGDTTAYDYLLKNTEPGLVKFEMDLYWFANAGQDPITWIKKYPGRFPLWHIKDMEAKTAGKPKGQTCEVGKGVIDWKSIFKYQKEAGVDYVFVEQEQYTRPVFECIKISADYMKKNLLK
ncbi:MAG: sugar phosphate isomerase/epimerase [Chitinophagaceae bacterium]